jgi:hypothetical protein
MKHTLRPQIEDHYAKALAAYMNECDNENLIMAQPSEANSTINAVHVNLKNSNGVVAKYNWRTGKLSV